MKNREFNNLLKSCETTLFATLTDEKKNEVALHVIRQRGPVIEQLITPLMDQQWLASMGYLYKTKGPKTGHVFIHTSAHEIK